MSLIISKTLPVVSVILTSVGENFWRRRMMLRTIAIIFLAHYMNSFCTAVTIDDVQISPDNPSIYDTLTIETQGSISGGTLFFDESLFAKDEFALQLNLYFTGGSGPQIPQPWFHDEGIGNLPQGSYDLSVQAYWRVTDTADYFLHDDYSTNFEVVPEPFTLSFLALGLAFIRKK